MPSLSDIIASTKREMGLPSGLKINVIKDHGDAVHGRTVVATTGLNALLKDVNLPDMRVGTFCEKFARCIGAQIGARVELEYAGKVVDGRCALKTLM